MKGNGKIKLKPCDKRRLLVADDDKAIREMYELVLSCDLPDCRIDMAVNGAEVVESFRAVHHGLLVMDVRMPVMDGEEAFREIRKICESENVEMPSIIFCTGFEAPHALRNIVAENPRHCVLNKPVDPDTLIEAMKLRLGVE